MEAANVTLDQEEAIFSDLDTEEVDEAFYMSRLFMLGAAGPFSSVSPHVSVTFPSYDSGISPQIGLITDPHVKRLIEDEKTEDSPLIHFMSQEETVNRDNGSSVKTEVIKGSLAEKVPENLTVTPKDKPIPTEDPRSESAEVPKFPHDPLQSVYSGEYSGPIRRSLRIANKHVCQKGEGKGKKEERKVIMDKDKDYKGSSVSPRPVDNSAERGKAVKSFTSPLQSTRGQQRPGTEVHISPGFHSGAIKNSKTKKVMRLSTVHKRNHFGETQLHIAVMNGNIASVKYMIKVGACINMVDNAGWTPLHEAVLRNNYTIAEMLLKAGAHVNCTGHEGHTTLHDAVQLGSYKMVDLLLKHGADPLLKNDSGKAPVDVSPNITIDRRLGQYLSKKSKIALSVHCASSTTPLKRGTVETGRTSCRRPKKFTAEVEDIQKVDETEPNVGPDEEGAAEIHDSTTETEASPKGVVGVAMRHDTNILHKELHVNQSLTSAANESNPSPCQDLRSNNSDKTVKRALDALRDDCETDVMNDGHSAITRKRMKRITTSKEKSFLDYLLNFDLSSVSVANPTCDKITKEESNTPASLLNRNVCNDCQPCPTAYHRESICEDSCASHTQNSSHQECIASVGLFAPCHKSGGSSLEGQSTVDINGQPLSTVTCSPFPREKSLVSSDIGSPSSLVAIIHNEGLTCSLEHQVEEELIGHLEMTSEPLNTPDISSPMSKSSGPTQGYEKCRLRPTFLTPNFIIDSFTMHNSSETNINTMNNATNIEPLAGSNEKAVSSALFFAKPHCQSDKTDSPIKPVLNGQDIGRTEEAIVHSDILNIACNAGDTSVSVETTPTGFLEMQASFADKHEESLVCSSSTKSPRDYQININHCRNTTPDGCGFGDSSTTLQAKEDDACVVPDDVKSSADSDCTVIVEQEQLNASQNSKESLVIPANLNKAPDVWPCDRERHSEQHDMFEIPEQQTERTTDPRNTEISLSTLIDLGQEPLCLHPDPALDNSQGKESVGPDDHHITGEKKEVSDPVNPSQHGKKAEIRNRQKKTSTQTNSAGTVATKQSLQISWKNLHGKNRKGETYLHKACMKGDLSLVKRLIEAGIDVNISDNAGWTALHEASAAGYTDLVEELLFAGADVTSKGLDGVTPLHDAVNIGKYEIVNLLLQYGADPHDKNAFGQSALDLAVQEHIKELLLTFKGPFVVPDQVKQSSKQSSETLTLEQKLRDKRQPPSGSVEFCCEDKVERQDHSQRCGSYEEPPQSQTQTIKSMLKEIEQKQKEMSVWQLSEHEKQEKFANALSEMQTVLTDILLKQQAEKNDLTKKYRIASDSFLQGTLRERLSDLASRQKCLLVVLREHNRLKHKVKMFRDKLEAQSLTMPGQHGSTTASSTGALQLKASQHGMHCTEHDDGDILSEHCYSAPDPLNPKSPFWKTNSQSVFTVLEEVNMLHQEAEKALISPVSQLTFLNNQMAPHPANQTDQFLVIDAESFGLKSPLCSAQQQNKVRKITRTARGKSAHNLDTSGRNTRSQICTEHPESNTSSSSSSRKLGNLIRKGVIQPGDSALELKLMGSCLKASVLHDGSIRDTSGKVFLDPEAWVSSVLGNTPVSSAFAWKKVMYGSESLWDCSYSNAEERTRQLQVCAEPYIGTGYPEGRKDTYMAVSSIHQISDEEFLPCYMMEKYWDLFTQSDNWDF